MAGKADDTLNLATDREVSVVNPYYNNTPELVIMGHLGRNGMMSLNLETGEYELPLATGRKWIDDTRLELELREGVTLHDSSSFGPKEVAFTVNFVANPDNGVLTQANVTWMQSAEPTGPHTVRIHLKEPFPAGILRPVEDLTFHVARGETLAIAGESGRSFNPRCLKALACCSHRAPRPARIPGGRVECHLYEGKGGLAHAEP
jgi:peptide/nickel transport system substrate-binding protein